MNGAGAATLTECDPADQGFVPRPSEVYNTPVVLIEPLEDHVGLTYYERHEECIFADVCGSHSGLAAENYYYVRFYDDGGGPSCEVQSEFDFHAEGDTPKPAAGFALNATEGVTGSPTLIGGSPRRVVSVAIAGSVNTYDISSGVYPEDCATAGVVCDTYDVSGPTGSGWGEQAGPDASALVDTTMNLAVWGNKCQLSKDCLAPWGSVYAVDVLPASFGNVLDSLDLQAWTFSAPVGLYRSPGTLGFVLGTDESTALDVEPGPGVLYAPTSDEYDCAIVMGELSGGSLAVLDHWDDERADLADNGALDGSWPNTCEYTTFPSGDADGVNGFVGEPVAPGGGRILALRRRAELNVFRYLAAGSLTRLHRIRFNTVSGAWRIPAEHSVVVGDFPDSATVEHMAFFAMNDVANGGGKVVALEPSVECPMGATPPADCDFDLDSALYGHQRVWSSARSPSQATPFWAPGALGLYVRNSGGVITEHLAYVLVESAQARAGGPAWEGFDEELHTDATNGLAACGPDELPPKLHIFHKSSTDASWTDESYTLGTWCYERANPHVDDAPSAGDPPPPKRWAPITSVSGAVIVGPSAYVATSDGRFWQLNTAAGGGGGGEADFVLNGYAEGWPRFRENNAGEATRY